MSIAPDSLKECRRYLVEQTAKPPENFSIRSARSARGYHAGKSQIFGPNGRGWRDYSVRHPRDKAGLSEASSAIDIKLPVRQLKALVQYLVAGARDGSLDIFEIIGPDTDGKANYWSIFTGWMPRPRLASADHEWHIHLAYPRDTEFADRVYVFHGYYEPLPMLPLEEADDLQAPDADTEIEALSEQLAELEAKVAKAREVLA